MGILMIFSVFIDLLRIFISNINSDIIYYILIITDFYFLQLFSKLFNEKDFQ